MKYLGMVAWVVTGLAAVAIGLAALGYKLSEMAWYSDNPVLVKFLMYVVGICGVLSLVMFFASFGKGCGCYCMHNPNTTK